MTTVEVNPGICGLGESVPEVDSWKVCFSPYGDSAVYKAARVHLQHAACPFPAGIGIVKAIEAEAGLALPANVEFSTTRE